MKNVSSAFREELKKDNRNYIKSADITLKNGTVLEIDNSGLWQNGMKLDTATSSPNSFDLGAIITGQLTLTLNNIDEKFSDYDFTDCTATNVKVGLKLPDGTTESLSYGKFYLNEAKYNGSIITLTFYDSIYKFDRPYSKSSLSYPATLRQIVQDACSVCGVTQGTFTFDQDDFVVQERPDDSSITFRQVLQWVGQISCQYFYADVQGRLRMAWYDVGLLDSIVTDVEEGFLQDTAGEYVLDHNSEKINTLKLLSEPDDDVEESPYDDTMFHEIESFTSLTTGLDDVVITGIRIIQEVDSEDGGKENITIQYGTDGYVLGIEGNKFITEENASDVAAMVGIKTIGMQFRSFSANALSDPTIEPGDVVLLIDRKKKRYKSIVTNNTFHPGNFQAFSCGAKSPIRNSSTRFSQITQVYTDYRKELSQQRTDIETALAELDDRIENSSGLFTTIEEQPDGSKKYFLHNKPILSESDIVWSMTAEAWGVSTDGGQTQNAGMTVDGDTIVRILTAVGVNADWIKTGAFRIEKDGEVMFSADTETGIIDIVANSFTLKGQSIEDIAENQVNDFVDAVYTPTIDNIQKQIDGQIETYYYDYEPTLENVPAIDWTSEEERRSHEGDLFYWKSRGYAYRFFKDGDTWKWQMVQDTDITKALQQAADAKDTADQKRRVFVVTPNPPYDVGDLWVGNDTSELMRCQRARSSGSYNADDWIKAVKYTDDTELNNFIREDYSETIQEIYNSVDKKAQTWYQTTDPSLDWASIEESVLQDTDGNSILDSENNDIITLWEKEKSTHDGDLWRNPANNTEYMYVDGNWVEMSIPDEVFDTIDGKAQIFVTQPVPPYDVGDTWFTGTTILVCDTRRDSGEFVAEDWSKQDNYTDDSALYEFIEGDYASTIDELQTQSDKKAETWYQANDPSTHWNADEKLKHDGDLWYNTSSQKTYIYNGSAWEETKSNPPDEVFDTIDGKAQIFVRQPVPPYSVGDLWFNSATSDIMTCITARPSGSYNAKDWEKRNKYTDDSYAQEINDELNRFIEDYNDEIQEIANSIDKKSETWYQTSDPADQWTDNVDNDPLLDTNGNNITDTTGENITTVWEKEKTLHDGDLWHNPNTNKEYIYVDGEWKETSIPDDVFDIIDGKAQIFVSTPTPPYAIGDLWFDSATSDIMTCINGRESGSYASSDWQKRNKYTDDSYAEEVAGDLSNFADQVVGDLENMQTQIDGKIETYYYDYQPTLTNIPASAWTTEEERQKHIGDLFYYKSTGFTYRFLKDGSTWKWQAIKDSDIDEALQQAATAQDTADGKRRVFTSTPTPPYDVGDLWAQGGSGDIMRCIVARSSGSYVSTDWDKASKYTDDTAVDDLDTALDQEGVFNRLTDYGKEEGMYIRDGHLYFNGTYIQSGAIQVVDDDGNIIFKADIDNHSVTISGDRVFIGDQPITENFDNLQNQIDSIDASENIYYGENLIKDPYFTKLSGEGNMWAVNTGVHATRMGDDYGIKDPLGDSGKIMRIWKESTASAGAFFGTKPTDNPVIPENLRDGIFEFTFYARTERTKTGDNGWIEEEANLCINGYYSAYRKIQINDSWHKYSIKVKCDSTRRAYMSFGINPGSTGESNAILLYKPECYYVGQDIKEGANLIRDPHFDTIKSPVPTSGMWTAPNNINTRIYTYKSTCAHDSIFPNLDTFKDPEGGYGALVVNNTGGVSDCFVSAISNGNNPVITDVGVYKVSVWLKAQKSGQTLKLSLNRYITDIELSTEWKEYSFVQKVEAVNTQGYEMFTIGGFGSWDATFGLLYIYNPRVEKVYSAEDTFNMLTDFGSKKGIYMLDGQLYFSFDYAQGGVLNLGGKYNGNGRSLIRDKNGNPILLIDYSGITFFTKYNENSSSYTYEGIQIDKIGIRKVSATKNKYDNNMITPPDDDDVIELDDNTILPFDGSRDPIYERVNATLVDGDNGIYRVIRFSEANKLSSVISFTYDVAITSFYQHTENGVIWWYATAILPRSSKLPASVSSIDVLITY